MRWWLHIHVTGFEIQSRNCHLRLTTADSSGQFRSGGIFSGDDNRLHTRKHCPAESRHPKFVKNVIQLQDRQTVILYYIEQMIACQDFSRKLYTKNRPVKTSQDDFIIDYLLYFLLRL